MVPRAQTPSTPGFTPAMDIPWSSRESEAASSSTKGGGGHWDRLRPNRGIVGRDESKLDVWWLPEE
jgi:hypothetical protein